MSWLFHRLYCICVWFWRTLCLPKKFLLRIKLNTVLTFAVLGLIAKNVTIRNEWTWSQKVGVRLVSLLTRTTRIFFPLSVWFHFPPVPFPSGFLWSDLTGPVAPWSTLHSTQCTRVMPPFAGLTGVRERRTVDINGTYETQRTTLYKVRHEDLTNATRYFCPVRYFVFFFLILKFLHHNRKIKKQIICTFCNSNLKIVFLQFYRKIKRVTYLIIYSLMLHRKVNQRLLINVNQT